MQLEVRRGMRSRRVQEEGVKVTAGGGRGAASSTEQEEGAQVTAGGGRGCSFIAGSSRGEYRSL